MVLDFSGFFHLTPLVNDQYSLFANFPFVKCNSKLAFCFEKKSIK